MALGIIKKETPFKEDSTKKTIYIIDDNLFRFWYRFVPQNLSLLQNSMIDVAYKSVSDGMSTYMGMVFEEICKQYLWQLNRMSKTPATFTELGRWWGNDPNEKKQVEIDMIAECNNDTAIFGECKWTNERVDTKVLETLLYRSGLFHYKNVYLYLFSKSGFTKGCEEKADELGNVTLVTFQDIMNNI